MPDEKSSYDPSGNTDQQSSAFTPVPPPIEQSEVRKAGGENPDQCQQDTKELAREIHWVEKATMWSQIGLGIIGIFALVVYHGQLTVMQRQLNEMAKATKAANASANAAKDALDLSSSSIRLDKRAWVGLAFDPVPMLTHFIIDPGSQNYEIQWYFLIHNFGPGVALNVVDDFEAANGYNIQKSVAETCDDAAKHYYGKRIDSEIQGGSVLFPGQQMGVPGTEMGNMQQLHSNGAVYIVGCIMYDDQFGKRHKTTTCLRTGSDMDFGAVSRKPQNLFTCESSSD
jgi:hypothetical protein